MGVTISINAISGITLSLYWTAPAAVTVVGEWGSLLALGVLGALGINSLSGTRNHGGSRNDISDYVSNNNYKFI